MLPTDSIEERVLASVPLDVTVTVTASPAKGLEQTLALTERLAGHGYKVVPHLAARSIVDGKHLRETVSRLKQAGVDDVFVPAGDADPPAGQFETALSVISLLAELDRPFSRVGITGYPESHPKISDDVTIQAMWDKRLYADYIVSNLCFDPAVLARWVARVRARGVTLPLYLGLAAPLERTKLLEVAAKIGVVESGRFVSKHPTWLAHLGAPGGYSPERFLAGMSGTVSDPRCLVEGLHVFTFNQVRRTEAWRLGLLERLAEAVTPPVGA